MEFHILPYEPMKKLVEKVAQREYGRILGSCRIDKAIQFFGYEHELIEVIGQAPCNRTIFVHNDMDKSFLLQTNSLLPKSQEVLTAYLLQQ
mgnify:CR=1 FL=1